MLKETLHRLLHCNFKIIIKSESRCLNKTNVKEIKLINLQNNNRQRNNSNSIEEVIRGTEKISYPLIQMNKITK
jgi:hypothetical protein